MLKEYPLIEKIYILETKIGHWTHSNLEPFRIDRSESAIHQAAEKIARHLGLPPLNFKITYTNQKRNVAGHIHDYSGEDVYIEIENTLRYYDTNIVLAVLAHEICHKYLQINNLKLFPERENEMLTDAATIFTGLGKLSLNGCDVLKKETTSDGINNYKHTSHHKVGYMDREQFAFVYRLVCEMRRVPTTQMFSGLTNEAKTAVEKVTEIESYYFKDSYFKKETTEKELSKLISEDLENILKSLAKIKRHIKVIENNILPRTEQMGNDFHLYLSKKLKNFNKASDNSKESLNYINNLFSLEEMDLLRKKTWGKEAEFARIESTLSKFIVFIEKSYPMEFANQNLDFLSKFNCPSCNYQMTINQKILAKVKCKNCNYTFIADTGLFQTHSSTSSSNSNKNKTINHKKDTGIGDDLKSAFQKIKAKLKM